MNRFQLAFGVAAAMLPLMTVPTAQAALNPLFPPDTNTSVLVLSPVERVEVNDWLSGAMCPSSNTCVDVNYASLNIPGGVKAMDTGIWSTAGPKVVFAYSGGAAVVANWLKNNADAPVADDLSFVLIGNPTRKYGGSGLGAVSVMPETGYHVIDISREYDSVSDFPDNPFNLLADANAFAGFMFIHLDYKSVNIYDPANTVWTEGNTTYVFVPTPDLPLLEPLRRLGLTALADKLNAPLKAMVDKAYDRSYFPPPTPPTDPTDPPTGSVMPALTSRAVSGAAERSSGPTTARTRPTLALRPGKRASEIVKPVDGDDGTATGTEPTATTTRPAKHVRPKLLSKHAQSSTSPSTDGNKVGPAKPTSGRSTTTSGGGAKPADASKPDGSTDGGGASE